MKVMEAGANVEKETGNRNSKFMIALTKAQ
jgi:hypothetical protein